MHLSKISNRQLTLLRKLNQKKYRLQEQQFLVEGSRAVEQIIENKSVTIEALYFDESQQYWQHQTWEQLAKEVDAAVIAQNDFADVSDTDSPQGVIALCRMPEETSLKKLAQVNGTIVAVDAIQDPGNLGTIIRTSGWFGVQGLLSGKGTVDLFHPKVVRSTAGATATVPFANTELEEALFFFEDKGWQVILLDAGTDSVPLKEINKTEKKIVVIGNEGNGIQRSLIRSERVKAEITSPRKEKNVESLNAAIAASIALYALV